MRQFTDARRTARGFRELRNRYVRRAEFLCRDDPFREDVAAMRKQWTELFPAFRLGHPLHTIAGVFPWRRPEEIPAAVNIDEAGLVFGWDTAHAIRHWDHFLMRLTFEHFPPWDYYVVGSRHPARGFLQATLLRGPQELIGSTDQFFELPRLELAMDMSEYEEFGIEPEDWELYDPDQRWFIPVYPGMTADDLKAAIPQIIEQVQTYLGPRTVGTRIEELSRHGKTQQEIADTLGLNVKSVQAHLRSAREQEEDATNRTAS